MIKRIDVRIAYEPDRKLAFAYNRIMEETVCEWVLFLDQDLFICNPHWYTMCLEAVNSYPQAGIISAKTNRINNSYQLDKDAPRTDNILDHISYSNFLWKKYKNSIIECKTNFSGFFILTSKTAWKEAKGFDESINKGLSKVDIFYSRKIKEKRKLYLMEGLYFYHLYKSKWKKSWSKEKWGEV